MYKLNLVYLVFVAILTALFGYLLGSAFPSPALSAEHKNVGVIGGYDVYESAENPDVIEENVKLTLERFPNDNTNAPEYIALRAPDYKLWYERETGKEFIILGIINFQPGYHGTQKRFHVIEYRIKWDPYIADLLTSAQYSYGELPNLFLQRVGDHYILNNIVLQDGTVVYERSMENR